MRHFTVSTSIAVTRRVVVCTSSVWVMKVMRQIAVSTSIAWVMKVTRQTVASTSSVWVMKAIRQITVTNSIAGVIGVMKQVLQLHSSLQVLLKRKKKKRRLCAFQLPRRQPGAMTTGHSPKGTPMSLHSWSDRQNDNILWHNDSNGSLSSDFPKQAEGWVMPTCWLISKRQLLSQLLTWFFSSETMQAWRSSSLEAFFFISTWPLSCSMEPECELRSSWPSALTLSWALRSVTTPEHERKACSEWALCGAEMVGWAWPRL